MGEYLHFFEQEAERLSDNRLTEEQRAVELANLNRMSEIHKEYILTVVDQFIAGYRHEANRVKPLHSSMRGSVRCRNRYEMPGTT